jgi:hypothetical protein
MGAAELEHFADLYMQGLRCIIDSMDDDRTLRVQLNKITQKHISWGVHKAHIIVCQFRLSIMLIVIIEYVASLSCNTQKLSR